MAGQVFAIASGKGGVGKTTTVVNLGVVLRRADHSVALVDADLGMANLGPMLGVNTGLTLHDVLSGRATVEDSLVEEAPGFAVLPGSNTLTDYPDADPENLGDVLETLAESYDFVLVDTGAGMSHEDVLPLGLADRVVLVASPDPAAIGDTRKTAELAGLAKGDIAGLVVTKADSDTDAKHVASRVGVDLLGVIPYDSTVRESTASGRPLEATDPDTPAAAAYRELASRLAEGASDLPTRSTAADEEEPDGTAGSPAAEPTADPVAPDEPADGAPNHEAESPAPVSDSAERTASEASAAETSPAAPEPTPAPPDSESSLEPDEAEPDTAQSEPTGEAADEPDESDDETGETAEPADGEEIEAAQQADDEPVETDDETPDDTAEQVDGEEPEATEEETTADEAEAEEDYLAEFEDDEPESKGGLISRIGRLFR